MSHSQFIDVLARFVSWLLLGAGAIALLWFVGALVWELVKLKLSHYRREQQAKREAEFASKACHISEYFGHMKRPPEMEADPGGAAQEVINLLNEAPCDAEIYPFKSRASHDDLPPVSEHGMETEKLGAVIRRLADRQ